MKLTEEEKAEAKKAFDDLANKLYEMSILLFETSEQSFPEDATPELRKQVVESMLKGAANAMSAGVESQIKVVTERLQKEYKNGRRREEASGK